MSVSRNVSVSLDVLVILLVFMKENNRRYLITSERRADNVLQDNSVYSV